VKSDRTRNPAYCELLDHLLADKEMLAGVRLKFRNVYNEIESSADPSGALATLLGELPAAKKPHYHEKSMGLTEAMSQARAIYSPWLGDFERNGVLQQLTFLACEKSRNKSGVTLPARFVYGAFLMIDSSQFTIAACIAIR
jgi:hypothetical protein